MDSNAICVCVCVCVLKWNAALGWQWHTVCSHVATTVRTHTELNIARFSWLIAVITGHSLKKEKGERDKKHLCHSSECAWVRVCFYVNVYICVHVYECVFVRAPRVVYGSKLPSEALRYNRVSWQCRSSGLSPYPSAVWWSERTPPTLIRSGSTAEYFSSDGSNKWAAPMFLIRLQIWTDCQ